MKKPILTEVGKTLKKEGAKIKKGIGRAKRKVELIKPFLIVDGLTLSNAMFGLLSIFSTITGHYRGACYFLLLAVAMDLLDGKVARRFGRSTEIGKELDSLADIVSFGVAPAVLGFVLAERIGIVIPLILFLSCGIIRLAKFNVQLVVGYYFGMPITVNGVIFPALYFAGVPINCWFYVYIVSAILMVSPFRLKKFL